MSKRRKVQGATKGYKPWTSEETVILEQHWRELGNAEMMVMLPGRSEVAIQTRRGRMGLTGARSWTVAEDAIMRELYPTKGPHGTAPSLPHRTKNAIHLHAGVLGLSAPSRECRRGVAFALEEWAAALLDDSVRERYWSKVERGRDCWLWTGSKVGRSTYFGVYGRIIDARWYGYGLAHGPEFLHQDGSVLVQSCTLSGCVNPMHRYVGSRGDIIREGLASGARKPNPPKGEKSPHAKVTEVQVLRMRQSYANGSTISGLSRIYKMSTTNASYIVHGQSWAHLPLPDYSLRDNHVRRQRKRKARLDKRKLLSDRNHMGIPEK